MKKGIILIILGIILIGISIVGISSKSNDNVIEIKVINEVEPQWI
jgi:hypothetical protein